MAQDLSKKKLHEDLQAIEPSPYTGTDMSKKKFKERLVAEGATPSDDYSKDHMINVQLPEAISVTTTTTTTATTVSTTSTTKSTASTTHTTATTVTTVTTVPPVISLVVGDPPPPATGPWMQTWTPVPGPAHFTEVDDGTLDPPSEADFITAVLPATAEHLEIGPPSTPGGVYTLAVVTLRMSTAVGLGDTVNVDIFDSAGAALAVPGPHVFSNTAPGVVENITVPIPLVGPSPDPAIISGVIELFYTPTPDNGITVFDMRIEWL